MSARVVVVLLPALCLVCRGLRSPMVCLSCSGCVEPWWPCRVGSGCSSCIGPAWYVLTVRRPPMVGCVLRGGKVATIGTTAEKSFEILYDMPCPALEAALQGQPIIWYFVVPFGRPFTFACADHMYTPVGGKAASVPLGASPCCPWEPQGAALARWSGACACVRLPVGSARWLRGLRCAVSGRVLRVLWCAR